MMYEEVWGPSSEKEKHWYRTLHKNCHGLSFLKPAAQAQARCIKLGGETYSEIRWRKWTGVTSPRGSDKAGC